VPKCKRRSSLCKQNHPDLKTTSFSFLAEHELLSPRPPPILAIWGLLDKCAECEIDEFDEGCEGACMALLERAFSIHM